MVIICPLHRRRASATRGPTRCPPPPQRRCPPLLTTAMWRTRRRKGKPTMKTRRPSGTDWTSGLPSRWLLRRTEAQETEPGSAPVSVNAVTQKDPNKRCNWVKNQWVSVNHTVFIDLINKWVPCQWTIVHSEPSFYHSSFILYQIIWNNQTIVLHATNHTNPRNKHIVLIVHNSKTFYFASLNVGFHK